MGRFAGTTNEFKRYIGPHLRNLIQRITRRQKAIIGACEHCGAVGELDAAHVHGRNRTDIINLLLGTSAPNALVDVDLAEFERAFKGEHDPVEKAILVLCRSCHHKYDRVANGSASPKTDQVPATQRTPIVGAPFEVLPISLNPCDPNDFKVKLLKRRKAIIEVVYQDGSVERKPWDASQFRESSNLFGNLRSRPEFRKRAWQESGIVKVNVRIVE